MKKTKVSVVILLTMIITLILGNMTFAATASTPRYFQLKNQSNGRNTGFYHVQTNNFASYKPVIKIVETNQRGTTEVAETSDSAIYCIKDGVGFGSNSPTNSVVEYSNYFNLKNKSEITEPFVNSLPQNADNYNALVWLLDNICIPNDSASRDALLTKAGLSIADFQDYSISGQNQEAVIKDIIEVVQQSAIWYFTNAEDTTKEFHPSYSYDADRDEARGPGLFYASSAAGTRQNLNTYYDGDADENPASELFKYLVESAKEAVENGYTPTTQTSNNSISFDKSRATVTLDGNRYLVGPYKVSGQLSGNYTFNVKVKTGTTEVTNATLVGANKTTELTGATVTDKVKSNLNQDFYIVLPANTSASSVKIEVAGSYETRTQTYWATAANTVNVNQPIVIIKKEPVTVNGEDTKNITKPAFDLALRKFIISINSVNVDPSREPKYNQDDLRKLANGTAQLDGGTTLTKEHPKNALTVKTGDKVVYTIRVYNEGDIVGYATEITDYLPEGLSLVPKSESTINTTYGWEADENDNKIIRTDYLKTTAINAFDKNPSNGQYSISYADVQVECKVEAVTGSTDTFLKNVAEITEASNPTGEQDRDSDPSNLTEQERESYNPGTSEEGKGYQDDDDYEDLVLPGRYFDLSLRKFISQVNDKTYNRAPQVDVTPLKQGQTTASYKHQKDPVSVSAGDTVIYTIKVYNEGQVDGYADEIVDHLPEELEFVNDEFNAGYGWKIDPTDETKRTIRTTVLSKENDEDNVIRAFDSSKTTLDSKEIKIKCKVISTAPAQKQITNIAEIARSSNDSNLVDRDNEASVRLPSDNDLPGYKGKETNKDDLSDRNYYYEGQEDDDDFEKVILQKFDLALRKFITGVNDEEITNREPEVDTSKYGTVVDGKEITTFEYNHTKEPVRVEQNDIVTYTIRVYNEGTQSGYAEEIKDDIPEGLEYLPENETNIEYGWVMLDKDGNETEDVSKAVSIVTDYRSRAKSADENLIEAYNAETMKDGPDYVDVKVAFKVTEPNTSDRIIINHAQVSEDADENGEDVTDIDSVPDEWNDGEDDQDIEKIYVKYFDLALRKWVTHAIVIEDGVQKEMATGHYAEQDPEPVVKVEVNKERINNTVIKFRYSIRVTNEGEIAGYATEISDYIPEGLKFNQADNPEWEEKDGKVVTTQLKDVLLEPGESAEVEIVLTWINGEDNMGVKDNWAEISEDDNESDTPDIDSTPNNRKEGEDDIDDAPVALTVVAGKAQTYIAIISGTLLIVGAGVLLIRKYVL